MITLILFPCANMNREGGEVVILDEVREYLGFGFAKCKEIQSHQVEVIETTKQTQ